MTASLLRKSSHELTDVMDGGPGRLTDQRCKLKLNAPSFVNRKETPGHLNMAVVKIRSPIQSVSRPITCEILR